MLLHSVSKNHKSSLKHLLTADKMMWLSKMKSYIDFSFTFEKQTGLNPANPLTQAAPGNESSSIMLDNLGNHFLKHSLFRSSRILGLLLWIFIFQLTPQVCKIGFRSGDWYGHFLCGFGYMFWIIGPLERPSSPSSSSFAEKARVSIKIFYIVCWNGGGI